MNLKKRNFHKKIKFWQAKAIFIKNEIFTKKCKGRPPKIGQLKVGP